MQLTQRTVIFLSAMCFVVFFLGFVVFAFRGGFISRPNNITSERIFLTPAQTVLPSPTAILPSEKFLSNNYHIFQSFNNCGPAALSMALSYYGIHITQEELGKSLRPYQISGGDNDDKSVTLEEVAQEAEKYGLTSFRRPNGNIALIKKFIALDIPVITRTWLKQDDDIGHYRIVKGYNETTQSLIQDDSLQGKNLSYSYDDFNKIWNKFNYEYLILVPKDKELQAQQILGEDQDIKTAWGKAVKLSQANIEKNPNDIDAQFNLSVALYNLGNYQQSVIEFEKVETRLSQRALWYQIEPIKSYFELKRYDRVLAITDKILNNHNLAFSELYVLRGKSYLEQGDITLAKNEFEKAVLYNKNLKEAQDALASVN